MSPPIRTITPSIHYFGTPVALLSTLDERGRPNLTPISSAFALGDRLLIGLSNESQGSANLRATGQAVLNLPNAALHEAVEALARTTGREAVPAYKQAMGYTFCADKFGLAGLSALPGTRVAAPRVAECPLQLELSLLAAHPAAQGSTGEPPALNWCELQVLAVHAHESIVQPGSSHIDPARWQPLLYVYRHYFGTGARLGRNFRAEVS